jgi:hypothetical protein
MLKFYIFYSFHNVHEDVDMRATSAVNFDEVPAFEEDQGVEREAMLSSPLKGTQRITSQVCSLYWALFRR